MSQSWPIDAGESAQHRVAARGLTVGTQDDGLAIRGKLNGTESHPRRQTLRTVRHRQRGTQQPHSHAVTLAADAITVSRQFLSFMFRQGGPVRSGDKAQACREIDLDICPMSHPPPGPFRAVGMLRRRQVGSPQGQAVTSLQRASRQTAQCGPCVGAAAAQYLRHIKPPIHGQIGPATPARPAKADARAGRCPQWPPGGQGRAVQRCGQIGAGQGDPGARLQNESGPQQGDFQQRRAGGIAHQEIGDARRLGIHGAAGGQAQVLESRSAKILDACEQAGVLHVDHYGSASASKAAASMALKRSVFPGASRQGGVRCGSKSLSGVRPMSCQPPGVAWG